MDIRPSLVEDNFGWIKREITRLKKLRNEELNNSPSTIVLQIEEDEMDWICSTHENDDAYKLCRS